MKKLVLLYLFVSLLFTTAFSQTKTDSILVAIDTIHVTGFVFDRYDKPLANVEVSSGKISTKTSKKGLFELKGIINKSHISFQSDTLSDIIFNNESRFILYTLAKPNNKLSPYPNKLSIESKRKTLKQQVLIKEKPNLEYGFANYGNPAQYPGGMDKFYKYIQDNLTYPDKAVKNNIEGIVSIEFDVTKSGTLDNFKIIKDIGYDTSSALIQVLKKCKKWNPSIVNGKPITVKFYLEVPFKLID